MEGQIRQHHLQPDRKAWLQRGLEQDNLHHGRSLLQSGNKSIYRPVQQRTYLSWRQDDKLGPCCKNRIE